MCAANALFQAIQARVGAGAMVSGVSLLPPENGETNVRLRVQVER